MILSNYRKENPISIDFDLKVDKSKLVHKESFCFKVNIKININRDIVEYNNIWIDKDSIENLISHIDGYLDGKIKFFDYQPLEGDFIIFEKPSKENINEIIKKMEKLDHYKNSTSELKSELEIIQDKVKLIFLVDDCKYYKGFSSGTGICYCIDVTKKQLNQFGTDLKQKYIDLIGINSI